MKKGLYDWITLVNKLMCGNDSNWKDHKRIVTFRQ